MTSSGLWLAHILAPITLFFQTLLDNKAYFFLLFLAWGEAVTSVAAAFMSKMIPLRVLAVINNVFGLASAFAFSSPPTAIKHAINLPLNATRWRQMHRLIDKVKEANEKDLNVDWLKPFMQIRPLKAGDRLFSIGDEANEAFVILEGEIELVERKITLKPGELFGEMALFTQEGRRTATAVCKTNVKLSLITYEGFEQLYFQNPEFGLYLVRLIVRRFNLNLTRAEETLRLREVELLDRLRMYEAEVSLPTGVDAGRNAIEVALAKHQDTLS